MLIKNWVEFNTFDIMQSRKPGNAEHVTSFSSINEPEIIYYFN
jgi:hypothetical protein